MTAEVHRLPGMRNEAGQASPYHQPPPASTSPDYEYAISFRRLRDWVRHLADNSSIVQSVLSTRVANGVGDGLVYEPMTRTRSGALNEELNNAIRSMHESWSLDADIAGELSRQEIEQLAYKGRDLDGEIFLRRVNQRFTTDPRELAYHVQLFPSDWVPGNLTQVNSNSRVIHGIESDDWGRRTNYFVDPNAENLFAQPGGFFNFDSLTKIPADQISHIKRTTSANETRGITIFHAVIFRIADIAEYGESHRLAARASADLFCAITRGADWLQEDESETSANGTKKRAWNFDHLQMIDGLDRGETVDFLSPSHPNQNAVDFLREEIRAIASATDVGASQIMQFYDRSFSAQRMERVDVWRKTERDRSQFIRKTKPFLYDWPVRVAQLERRFSARAMRRLDPATLFNARVDGPPMPVIDPVVERTALKMDQDNGWDARTGIIRRLARIPQDVDSEIEADRLMENEEIPTQAE